LGKRKGTLEDMGLNTGFWRGKSVLLTGHTGFKGSWLSLWLQSLGAKVIGYALTPPTDPNLFDVARVADGMRSVTGDIRDLERLTAIVAESRPEIVIHMAAQSLLRFSYDNPVETYATNLMGTVNLLESVRHAGGVRAVVVVTSDKCYENREWLWGYRENDPIGGFDPYSSSKGCAELATSAYRNSFFHADRYSQHGVAVASARAGNVVGGGDWAMDRLVPDILRAIESAQSVRIRRPDSIRPWQHALDPLSGYLLLAEKLYEAGPSFSEGWNFGPEDEDAQTVQWVVERLIKLSGKNTRWERDAGSHPHEAHYLKLDCSKSRARLGWEPRWNLDEALTNLMEWHKALIGGADMRRVSLDQIANYQSKRGRSNVS
jgi:CDP-glucose 4,6-dehydratase